MRYIKTAMMLSLALGLSVTQAYAQLKIIPNYGNSIMIDPDYQTIKGTIESAISVYETTFANPVTVNITFNKVTSGLGSSSTLGTTVPFNDYRDALQADKNTANDAALLNYLPPDNDPTYGNKMVRLSTANLRTLGFYINNGGQPDSTISLNTSQMNLSRIGVQDKTKYDLQAVVSHEINEALGLASQLNNLPNGATPPTGTIGSLDLFRYAGVGNRSFTTDANALPYFSVDGGTTSLVGFNQAAPGDYQDWFSNGLHTARVQDAFGTPGVQLNLGTAEFTALRVVGYNLAPTPEPSAPATLALGAFGLVGLVAVRRRRSQENAVT